MQTDKRMQGRMNRSNSSKKRWWFRPEQYSYAVLKPTTGIFGNGAARGLAVSILLHYTIDANLDRPKACMRTRNSLYTFLCLNLSSRELIVVKPEQAIVNNVYISSAYKAHERSAPPEELKRLTSIIYKKRKTYWRGATLMQGLCFAAAQKSTFHFPNSENYDNWFEVLDITLLNDNGIFNVKT